MRCHRNIKSLLNGEAVEQSKSNFIFLARLSKKPIAMMERVDQSNGESLSTLDVNKSLPDASASTEIKSDSYRLSWRGKKIFLREGDGSEKLQS